MENPKPTFEIPENSSFSLEEINCYLLDNGFIRLDFRWSGEEKHKRVMTFSSEEQQVLVFKFEDDETAFCAGLESSDYHWELIEYSDFCCSIYFSKSNWKSIDNKEPYIHWKKE